MPRLQLKRGLAANLPTSNMLPGEPMITTDQGTMYIALDATTKLPLVPAAEALATLASVAGAEDLVMVYDASEASGQRLKKMTFAEFKNALNIPAESSDEKLAVVAGGTAGYLWGTDGTDGIMRMGPSMAWTKDVGDAYVTLNVDIVDGGTF